MIALTKKGKSGAEEIQAMMDGFRSTPPTSLGGSKIVTIKDYKSRKSLDIATGETSPINLPSSNVLQFFTEDGSIVSARPSGTEPKIKFYCSVNDHLPTKSKFREIETRLNEKLDRILEDLGAK